MTNLNTLDPCLGYLLAGGFSICFGLAAIQKWRGLSTFSQILTEYDIAPRVLIGPAALAIPVLEWTVSVLVWLPSFRASAAMLGGTLLTVYGVAIGVNLARGRRHIDCGCAMGSGRRAISRWMLWRNGILTALLLTLRLPWSTRPVSITDAVTVVGGLMGFCLVYLSVDRLMTQSFLLANASRNSE